MIPHSVHTTPVLWVVCDSVGLSLCLVLGKGTWGDILWPVSASFLHGRQSILQAKDSLTHSLQWSCLWKCHLPKAAPGRQQTKAPKEQQGLGVDRPGSLMALSLAAEWPLTKQWTSQCSVSIYQVGIRYSLKGLLWGLNKIKHIKYAAQSGHLGRLPLLVSETQNPGNTVTFTFAIGTSVIA